MWVSWLVRCNLGVLGDEEELGGVDDGEEEEGGGGEELGWSDGNRSFVSFGSSTRTHTSLGSSYVNEGRILTATLMNDSLWLLVVVLVSGITGYSQNMGLVILGVILVCVCVCMVL